MLHDIRLVGHADAGVALLMVILGGIQIIFSHGEDAKIGEGKSRMVTAIIGLLILIFSAAILNMLNASYYKVL